MLVPGLPPKKNYQPRLSAQNVDISHVANFNEKILEKSLKTSFFLLNDSQKTTTLRPCNIQYFHVISMHVHLKSFHCCKFPWFCHNFDSCFKFPRFFHAITENHVFFNVGLVFSRFVAFSTSVATLACAALLVIRAGTISNATWKSSAYLLLFCCPVASMIRKFNFFPSKNEYLLLSIASSHVQENQQTQWTKQKSLVRRGLNRDPTTRNNRGHVNHTKKKKNSNCCHFS